MGTPWVPNIVYIIDGEAVKASTPNRPLQQLGQRTQYLYEQLIQAQLGESLVARNQPLATGTVPGTPVYFDPVTGQWTPGKAEIDLTEGNYGWAADSAYIQGFVLSKASANAGDVGLSGLFRNSVYGINWTTVIDNETLEPGTYFLSAEDGKISKSRNILSVYTGTINANGDITFLPFVNGNLRDHIHYRFDLTNAFGATLDDQGWIPAAEFDSADIDYPAGTIYGYNVAQDSTLAANFPPIPLLAQALYRDGLLLIDDDSVYVIDNNGIWWLDGGTDPVVGAPDIEAPLALWVTRSESQTASVNSLISNPNPDFLPVIFRDLGDDPATNGDLQAAIEQFFPIDGDLSEGALALKEVNVDGTSRVRFGPAINRIRPGSNMVITGTQGNATDGFYGTLTLNAGVSGNVVGIPQIVALNSATEEFYQHLPATTFPKNRTSSVRYQVSVPTNIAAGSKLKLSLDIIGTIDGAITLNVGYTRVQDGVAIPVGDTAIASLNPTLVNQQKVTVETEEVTVNPGDVVSFLIATPTSNAFDIPVLKTLFVIGG